MLKPYRIFLVVQGSGLHNEALGSSRDIGCFYVSVASGSIGSAIFDKDLVMFMVVCYGVGIS